MCADRKSGRSPTRSAAWLTALTALFVSSLGHAAVPVDQSPLTTRSVLAANIVLMLDDSGSMDWMVMPDNPPGSDGRDTELINSAINGVYYNPDILYLPPYTAAAQPEAVTPTFTRYPNSSFTAAPLNGFDSGSSTRNIATYKASDSNDGPNAIDKAPRVSHTFRIDTAAEYEYVASLGCPSGFQDPDGDGTCTVPNPVSEAPRCQGFGSGRYVDNQNQCQSESSRPTPCGSTFFPGAPGQPNSLGLQRLSSDRCRPPSTNNPNEAPRCQGYTNNYSTNNNNCSTVNFRPSPCASTVAPGANGSANSPGLSLVDISGNSDMCRSEETTVSCPANYSFASNAGPNGEDCRRVIPAFSQYRSLFVYMDRVGSGTVGDPYVETRHYVGVTTASNNNGSSNSPEPGTCAEVTGRQVVNEQLNQTLANGLDPAVCHDMDDDSGLRDASNNVVTYGQNVANWFSYYRKRLYMAKSGLMNAFATLEPGIRLGFGSINGISGTGNANRLPSPQTGGTPRIAKVAPFGSGASGTQRAEFWSWLEGATADDSTPLLRALNAVGAYYDDDDQPWQSGTAENAANPTEELACRQSYSILMTDGFWNGANPNLGEWDTPATATRVNGPNGQCFEYPQASANSACQTPPNPKPFVGSTSNTLADIAMKYWVSDLRAAENSVPATSDDPAFWQHMSTFTVGLFGQDAGLPGLGTTTANDIALWASSGGAPASFVWPTPSADSANNISDLVHAGVNGHGGFYSAGNPEEFEQGIRDALRRVQDRAGTGASLAANSTRLDTGTTTYQSVYYTGQWRGELNAFAVDPSTGAIASVPDWSASDELPAWNSRNIKTYNPSGADAASKFPSFSDPATLSAAQRTALGTDTAVQQEMINYLRGDSSQERRNGGTMRNRTTPLGDIVNSEPVYVGAPNASLYSKRTFTGASSHRAYANSYSTRSPRIWVAANDGFLHSFNALTGAEVFAFMPNAVVLSGVKSLAGANYGGVSVPHKFYNDGEVTVADAYIGGAWKTILVGTTGRGPAKAVYALDVTNADSPSILWERSADDGLSGSDYIGQMTGKPVIAQTANGSWSVLLGNGYNSAQGKAALLQFSLANGSLSVHQTNSDGDNGLAAPVVWIADASNAIGTHAYAGDQFGRVWAFDLSSATSTGTTLFTAAISGQPQKITAGMLAGRDPKTGNVWLFFGTGRSLASGDLSDTSVQTWYGIIAQPGPGKPASLVTNLATGRSALVERRILEETAPAASPPTLGARRLDTAVTGDMSGKSGWYMDLKVVGGTAKGERITISNQFQGNMLLATTSIPGTGSNRCNPSGDGWIMAVDPFLGSAPQAVFFDINADAVLNNSDKISGSPAGGIGFTSIPNSPIFVGNVMLISFDDATTSSIWTSGSTGALVRESWREFISP